MVLFQVAFEKFNQTVLRFPFTYPIKLFVDPLRNPRKLLKIMGSFEVSFEKSIEVALRFLLRNPRKIMVSCAQMAAPYVFSGTIANLKKKNQLQGNSSSSLLAGIAKHTIGQNQAFQGRLAFCNSGSLGVFRNFLFSHLS